MRLSPASAMKIFPPASTATPKGALKTPLPGLPHVLTNVPQGSVVLVVVVVEVLVAHTSVTMPLPSVVTVDWTQLLSTRFRGDPPSGHIPAFLRAAVNLSVAFERQVP